MMPRGLSLLIGLSISVPILMVEIVLGLLLPAGIGKQIYFFILPFSALLFILLVPRAIRGRVYWTPNPRRDRILESGSIRLIKSITILSGACAVFIDIWVHHRLNLFDITMVLGMLLMIRGKSRR